MNTTTDSATQYDFRQRSSARGFPSKLSEFTKSSDLVGASLITEPPTSYETDEVPSFAEPIGEMPPLNDHLSYSSLSSQRYSVGAATRAAINLSRQICHSLRDGDLVSTGLYRLELKDKLQMMWSNRGVKDEYWQTILNYLQIAISDANEFNLSIEQAESIESVLRDSLGLGTNTNSDVIYSVKTLKKHKLNPFASIQVDTRE